MSRNFPETEPDGGGALASPHMPPGAVGRIAGWVFRATALFGMVCLFGAGLVTVTDIALRFVDAAVPGVVDIVQLLILATAFAAIPFAFFRDGHVSVDLVTRALPVRLQAVMALLTALAALGLMGLVLWYGWSSAAMQITFGDVSQNLRIPMIWYWLPLLIGSGLSMLACLFAVWSALVALVRPEEGLPRA